MSTLASTVAFSFAALDTAKLFEIAARIVSNETVEEVHEFAAMVKEAADLVIASAKRIVTGEVPRDLETADRVNQVVKEYQAYQA